MEILQSLIQFIVKVFTVIIGIILSIIFVFIPTLILDVEDLIAYIEEDTCVDIPEEYSVEKKYEDWLAFEQHQELVLRFNKNSLRDIEEQIETVECENGVWVKENEEYIFKVNDSFTNENNYMIESKIDLEEGILVYNYSSF